MRTPSQRLLASAPLRLFGVVAAMSISSSVAWSQSVPASEGGSYLLSRMRVAGGTTQAQSPEAGTPRYRLQATIGQAEADQSVASSPRYRLHGGFWATSSYLPSPIFADGFED